MKGKMGKDNKSKKKVEKKGDLDPIADFLFEVGMLAKTPRSGFFFLGSGEQSVAEHTNRVSYIGFVLAHMNGKADVSRVLQMCLFHDITETRISDLNYVHQKYTERLEDKALSDLVETLPFGNAITKISDEYHARKSMESLLAKDADNIEFLLCLKEQADIGNERALTWIPSILQRFKTVEAKMLAEKIIQIDSDRWWFSQKDSDWWINRNNK